MPRLSPQPADVQMQFVLPDVKKGDYYNFRNPLTGRTMYVYPFMMGERYFPAVWLASRPQEWTASMQQTQQDVREARQWMKVAVAASLVASGLVVWMAFFKKD
jgi:hypothetical protein